MVVRSLWLVPISSSVLTITAYSLPNDQLARAFSAQILNVSAMFISLAVYLRHRQIVEYYGNRLKIDRTSWRSYSVVLLWTGLFASLALTLEANFFNEPAHQKSILGRLFAAVALIYFLGQVIFAYMTSPPMFWPFLNHGRLFLSFTGMSGFLWMTAFEKTQIFYLSSDSSYSVLNIIIHGSVQLLVSSLAIELWFSYVHVPKLLFSPIYYNVLHSTADEEDE